MPSYHQTPKLIRFDLISQSELELQHTARVLILHESNALCAFYGDYDRELIQGPVKIAMAEMLDNVGSKVEACSQMARKKFYKSIDEQYAMNLTVFEQTESGWRAKLASEITVLQAGEEEVEEQYQNDHEVDMGGTLAIRTLEALKSLDKIHLVEEALRKITCLLKQGIERVEQYLEEVPLARNPLAITWQTLKPPSFSGLSAPTASLIRRRQLRTWNACSCVDIRRSKQRHAEGIVSGRQGCSENDLVPQLCGVSEIWTRQADALAFGCVYLSKGDCEFSVSAIDRGMKGLLDADRREHRLWLQELEEKIYPGHPSYALWDFELMDGRGGEAGAQLRAQEKELKAREVQLAARKAWMAVHREEAEGRRSDLEAPVLSPATSEQNSENSNTNDETVELSGSFQRRSFAEACIRTSQLSPHVKNDFATGVLLLITKQELQLKPEPQALRRKTHCQAPAPDGPAIYSGSMEPTRTSLPRFCAMSKDELLNICEEEGLPTVGPCANLIKYLFDHWLQIDKVIAALERFRAEKEYINKRQTKADNKFTRLEIASAQFGRDEMIGISKSVHANKVYDAEVSDKKLNKKIPHSQQDKEDHDEGFFQPPIPPRSLHKQARSLKELYPGEVILKLIKAWKAPASAERRQNCLDSFSQDQPEVQHWPPARYEGFEVSFSPEP
ncbi:hypothetical protein JHW43_008534 [Diplocarpon mali]|nr:hypothetical protein JHW43_008534 [Diplocarpon mali]